MMGVLCEIYIANIPLQQLAKKTKALLIFAAVALPFVNMKPDLRCENCLLSRICFGVFCFLCTKDHDEKARSNTPMGFTTIEITNVCVENKIWIFKS